MVYEKYEPKALTKRNSVTKPDADGRLRRAAQAEYLQEFLGTTSGRADALIAYCAGGETCARAAAGSPALVGALVLNSTPAVPGKDPCKAYADVMVEHIDTPGFVRNMA